MRSVHVLFNSEWQGLKSKKEILQSKFAVELCRTEHLLLSVYYLDDRYTGLQLFSVLFEITSFSLNFNV